MTMTAVSGRCCEGVGTIVLITPRAEHCRREFGSERMIAAAGIGVFERETMPLDGRLIALSNANLTEHVA